jgi:uncharacterized integral membrane protein (TIGR00698 family)
VTDEARPAPQLVALSREPQRRWGLVAVAAIAGCAFALNVALPAVTPLILATGLGVLVAPFLRRGAAAEPGLRFAAGPLLRAGVVLLGLRVSASELTPLGRSGLILAVATVAITLLCGVLIGRALRVPAELTMLISIGSAICGASAIATMSSVNRADKESVGYAVGVVTVFGTLAMLVVPAVGTRVLGMSATDVGMWAGASIQEVAQVTAAGAAVSAAALKLAVLVKLARVALLGPAIGMISAVQHRRPGTARAAIRLPAFVWLFLGLVVLRTLIAVPADVLDVAMAASTALLAAGLTGLALQIDVAAVRLAGWRPLVLGAAASLIATSVGLLLVVIRIG